MFRMQIVLQIFQDNYGGSGIRLEENINMPRSITLEEAAKILTKFSELAKSVAVK